MSLISEKNIGFLILIHIKMGIIKPMGEVEIATHWDWIMKLFIKVI